MITAMPERVDWRQYIHSDPQILVGKPVIRGTRISVELVMDFYAAGWSIEQILDEYGLSRDQVMAVFSYAADVLRDEGAVPLARGSG
jgi:uncharacterized protein (DUF433 family)